jgi:hypothetical protein
MALTEKLTAIADAIRSQSGKAEKLTLDQMPNEITGLQSLSFEVVGNPQPENPKENTIWVDTDVEITGWDFSAAEPVNPAQGMVWFAVGTESTVAFNALKENSVMVYPLSAKQYAGGAWVDKTAKSYRNGELVEWFTGTYFYKAGDECTTVTGGWERKVDNTYNTLVKNATNMVVHGKEKQSWGYIGTTNKVELKDTLCVDMEATNCSEESMFGVKTDSSLMEKPLDGYVASTKITGNVARTVLKLQTSSIGVPAFVTFTASGSTVFKIYNAWTE